MSSVARVGDVHEGICGHGDICCPHNVTGTIVEGSPNVVSNSKSQARDGGKVVHNCPHCGTGYIVASSNSVRVNGKLIARVGDTVIYPGGEGKIVEGSSNVFSG